MKRFLLILMLLCAVALSGCMSFNVDSKVSSGGAIKSYKMVINTSPTVHSTLVDRAEEEGYSTVGEYLTSSFKDNLECEANYDQVLRGDTVSYTLEATNCEPVEGGNISIYEEDGKLVYEDKSFVNEDVPQGEIADRLLSDMTLDYHLEMPGEITDSNADKVEGNTAEWHLSGTDVMKTSIYARSELPLLPGFQLVLGAAGLILALMVLRKIKIR